MGIHDGGAVFVEEGTIHIDLPACAGEYGTWLSKVSRQGLRMNSPVCAVSGGISRNSSVSELLASASSAAFDFDYELPSNMEVLVVSSTGRCILGLWRAWATNALKQTTDSGLLTILSKAGSMD
jgi:hypothetical protein